MSTQQLGSYFRQAIAILSIVFGVLTQALSGIKLSAGISVAMTIVGGVLLGIEHYVGDPSTGTPPKPPAPPPAA